MNCLEFRRRCITEPNGLGPDCAAHRQQCLACARFAKRMTEFEDRLRGALAVDVPAGLAERITRRVDREDGATSEDSLDHHLGRAVQVDIPEGLAGRVLLRHSFERQREGRNRSLLSVALAAGLALAGGLTILLVPPGPGDGLAQEVIAHVQHEPQALLSRAEVKAARLTATLAKLGIALDQDIGPVTYAGLCEIGPSLGAHLVVAGQHGPVTIIVLPDKFVQRAREFESDGYRGVLLPARRGSIAVVAEHPQPVAPMAQQLDVALRWSL